MNDKGKGIMEQNDSDFGDNYDDESPPDEGHMLSIEPATPHTLRRIHK